MKKRNNFLMTLAIVLCVSMTMISCGSGGGSGLLGDLPNTVAEMRAEEASYKEKAGEATDFNELGEIAEEAKEKEKEYEAEIAEISKGLIGIVIPSEIAEGLPYKISSDIKITEISSNGGMVEFAIPITTTADILLDGSFYMIYMICVDADGKLLSKDEGGYLGMDYYTKNKKLLDTFALGTAATTKYRHSLYNRRFTPEEIIKAGSIAKIRFVNKEEFDKQ